MPLFSDINTWAVICLLAGLVLMVVEIFTPGFGLAGGSGLVLMAAAIILQAKSILEALILTAMLFLSGSVGFPYGESGFPPVWQALMGRFVIIFLALWAFIRVGQVLSKRRNP